MQTERTEPRQAMEDANMMSQAAVMPSTLGCVDLVLLKMEADSSAMPARPADPRFEVDGRSYTLTVARTRTDRIAAYRLVFDTYHAQGFAEPGALPLWYSIHNCLPETVTFLVRNEDGAPVASGTVVPDSPFGLPLERMYPDEVDTLRRAGRRVCEINSLVSCAASEGWRGRTIIMEIFKAGLWYARDILGATDWLCVTSPEHARFYRHALLLDEIGPLRQDPHANGAASVLLRLDTTTAEAAFQRKYEGREGARNLYRFFCPSRTDVAWLETWMRQEIRPVDEADFCHFFLETQNLIHGLSPEQFEFLQTVFPGFRLWTPSSWLGPATNECPAPRLGESCAEAV